MQKQIKKMPTHVQKIQGWTGCGGASVGEGTPRPKELTGWGGLMRHGSWIIQALANGRLTNGGLMKSPEILEIYKKSTKFADNKYLFTISVCFLISLLNVSKLF